MLAVVLAMGWLEVDVEFETMWAVLGASVVMCLPNVLPVVAGFFGFCLPVVLQFAPCVAFLSLLFWRLSRRLRRGSDGSFGGRSSRMPVR